MIRKLSFLLLAFYVLGVQAQNNIPSKKAADEKPITVTRILFLLDASGSMTAKWERNTRMAIAKNLLTEIVDSLKPTSNTEVALRVYGHQSPKTEKDCRDTKLEVPFYPKNHNKIIDRLKTITPKGATPIAFSLMEAANDFPDDPYARNIVIIITDGLENCDGDPCAVSLALQKKRIILKPFIIGLGLDIDVKKAFDCVGTFFEATQEQDFQNVLKTVVAQALNTTTLQLNLLDETAKPSETNVPICLYDANLNIERYAFMHTMNSRGLPDTLIIDPINTYDVYVYTNPMVIRKGVKLKPGQHNTIEFNAPQGQLSVTIPGVSGYKNLKIMIRKAGTYETIALQEVNTTQKYITGTYDLEILTLPITKINNIKIKQSDIYKVQLPQPGFVTFSSYTEGFGALFLLEGNKLAKIYDLNPNEKEQTVLMQPGIYKVIYRSKNATNSIFSKEKEFVVKSGATINIGLLN